MESVSTQVDSKQVLNENQIDDEYYADEQIIATLDQYISTTLVATRNITIADVLLQILDFPGLKQLVKTIKAPNNNNTRRITIIDPRNVLKEENKEGIVETLVPYNQIDGLIQKAYNYYNQYNINHEVAIP